MNFSPIACYSLAAVFQIAGSSGAAMLAPFFMKAHGYSIASASMPLVVNGIGRVCSDLLSGVLASYFSSGALIIAAAVVAIVASGLAALFFPGIPVFLAVFAVLGVTEAIFALSIRKIAFEQSNPARQGRAQGQVAAALGIGFSVGPFLGGLVGKHFGPDALFALYALPQLAGLVMIFLGGAHRARVIGAPKPAQLWREGRKLLGHRPFLASSLAMFQSFIFLVGVTRIAFPFLAVNQRDLGLDTVGTMISASRLTDTFGRYTGGWLCDRFTAARVIMLGVAIGVPMLAIQPYSGNAVLLALPLMVMTMGFGCTNVSTTTFALQAAEGRAKALALGLTRACSSLGNALGPLIAGVLIQTFGYQRGFETMAALALGTLALVWLGLKQKPAAAVSGSDRISGEI